VDLDSAVIVPVDPLIGNHNIISGLFAKFQKGTISFITTVGVSTSTKQNSVPAEDFRGILYWEFLSKSCLENY
jgi:hypothetical protein